MEAVAFGGKDADKKTSSQVIYFERTVTPKEQVSSASIKSNLLF